MKMKIAKLGVASFFCISASALGNVISQDTSNFNPTTNGIDFLTVQSSETLQPWYYNLGLFFNHAVNSLPYFDDGEVVQGIDKYNDALTMMDLNAGIGLFKDFEIGFSYPQLISQYIKAEGSRGQFGQNGNTELRFMMKYRFWGDSDGGGATAFTTNINRITNNPYQGDRNNPIYNIELIGDTRINSLAVGGNLGYRVRQPGEPVPGSTIEPTDDQVIASVAASYLLNSIDSKLISEIFGSSPVDGKNSPSTNRRSSSAELIVGLKHDITRSIALHGGVGTELISGVSSPDWRVYVGINYANYIKFDKKKEKEPAKKYTKKSNKKEKKPRKQFRKSPGKIMRPQQPKPQQVADPLTVPPVAGKTVIVLDDVNFEFDSYEDLLPGAIETIERLVDYLNRPPVYKNLRVEGHTDYVGSKEYNTVLSFKRAWKIRSILVEKFGLNPTRITALGFGKERPIADNGNYQGRQENRRVEFHIER